MAVVGWVVVGIFPPPHLPFAHPPGRAAVVAPSPLVHNLMFLGSPVLVVVVVASGAELANSTLNRLCTASRTSLSFLLYCPCICEDD
jgi:hypothetical protein